MATEKSNFRPLRVVVASPPLDASGGIGRVMSYALATIRPADAVVRVLDSRGHMPNPAYSLFPLLRVCVTLISLRLAHAVDVAHVNLSSHGSTLRKGAVVAVCRLAGIPVVLHLHACSYPEFFERLSMPAQQAVRRIFSSAASVVVLSNSWRRYVCDTLHVSPERVTVLPNAAPGALGTKPVQRLATEPARLVFLGRLGTRKGVPELLEALAGSRMRDQNWFATFAGDGDVEGYRQRAAELGIVNRTCFTGWLSATESSALLSRAHVLILPSHAEGSPMSVIEAFAHAVPVVATPVGGVPEVVVDSVNGMLTTPGDPDALADSLTQLLGDEQMRQEMGRRAHATWCHGHMIQSYTAQLLNVWRQVHTESRGATRTDQSGDPD
jgi:glycosyltransferase involved in cell wall biosynthesis